MIETAFDKSVVEAQLAVGISTVEFYKLDGSVRTISGTRDMDAVPEDKRPSGTAKSAKSSTTVTFFDVEDECWKSFVLENLISITKK